jgi:hypothetical protein
MTTPINHNPYIIVTMPKPMPKKPRNRYSENVKQMEIEKVQEVLRHCRLQRASTNG